MDPHGHLNLGDVLVRALCVNGDCRLRRAFYCLIFFFSSRESFEKTLLVSMLYLVNKKSK